PAATAVPTSSDGRSWIHTPANAARTAALTALAASGTRTAESRFSGTRRRRLSAVYATLAQARPALATANPTKPSHGTSAAVSTHRSTALARFSRKTTSGRPRP